MVKYNKKKNARKSNFDFHAILQKIKNPKPVWYYLFPVIITFLFVTIVYICAGIFPFGKNTIACYDLHAQIVTFAEQIFDIFEGKASLFYSHQALGDIDTFGAYTFCLLSPTIWILLICGKSNVIYAVNIYLLVKLLIICISAVYTLRKLFKRLNAIQVTVLALLYAFSGFFASCCTYINWLDMVAYLPLMHCALKRIIDGGSFIPFALTFAGNVCACYALGSFTMILLFAVISIYLFFNIEKENRKRVFTRVTLGFLTGLIIVLPLIIPAFITFTKSSRQSSFTKDLFNGFIFNNFELKITYVLSDVIFLGFVIAFIFVKNLKDKKNLSILLCLIITFLPILIDEVAIVFNFGGYYGYCYRCGLSFTFMTFITTAKLYDDFLSDEYKEVKNNNFALIINAIAGVGLLIMAIVFVATTCEKWCTNFSHGLGIVANNKTVWKAFIGISLLSLPVISTLVLCKKKIINFKWSTAIVLPLAVFQILTVGISAICGNLQSTNNYQRVYELTENIDEDLTFVRFKDGNNIFHTNFTMIPHFSSYAMFSSNVDERNFVAPAYFGYQYTSHNSLKSYYGTAFADCVLGYKYEIYTSQKSAKNLELISQLPTEDNMPNYLYKNKYSLPTAFGINTCEYQQDKMKSTDLYNSFYKMLGGTGNIANNCSISAINEQELSHASYSNNVLIMDNPTTACKVQLYTSYQGNKMLYTSFPKDSQPMYSYNNEDWYSLSDIKAIGTSNTMIYFKVGNKKYKNKQLEVPISCTTISDEEQFLKSLYDTAVSNKANVKFTKNGYKISYQGDCKYLFLNGCNLDGYTIKDNGVKVKAIDNTLNLLIIELAEGTSHNVSIKYTSPYGKMCLIVACVSLALLGLIYYLNTKYDETFAKLEKVVYILYLALFFIIIAVFSAFPIFVSMINLII